MPSVNDTGQRRAVRSISLFVIAIGLIVSCQGLERLNTWYLASDQFAFLTMAEDLRVGRVTRTDFLYDFLPGWMKGKFDALAQTYHLQEGVLHSRYPPGFPALLAVTGVVFGEWGVHWVNPLLYLVVFLVLARLTYLALREHDGPVAHGAAAAAVWLLLLLPTDVHLWGITVARDLPAHLLGLLALLAAVGGRFGWAGFALGVSCVVRPDSVLYVTSLGCIAFVRGGVVRSAGWGALGFFFGSLPLFAYNWAVLGSPFSFTQGSEFRYFLAAFSPFASTAHAAPFVPPAGGGFRAAHFARTMQGNLEMLAGSFGWLVAPAVVAAVVGLVRARVLVALFVPYAVTATVFYGFWGHPDPRYLAGVSLCLMPLAATGLVVVSRRVADPESSVGWRVGAAGVLVASLARLYLGVDLFGVSSPGRIVVTMAVLTTALALCSVRRPLTDRVRFAAPVAAPVALMVLALVEAAGGGGWRDPYQRDQIERSRRVIADVVPAGSVIITSPALGRPAENITHYTGVRAVYASELTMLPIKLSRAATFHKLNGLRVFYLLPPGQTDGLAVLPSLFHTRVERRIRPNEALDWFLNPREARRGAVLHEVEFNEGQEVFAEGVRLGHEAIRAREQE